MNGEDHDGFLARHGATVGFLLAIIVAIGAATYVSINDAEQDSQIREAALRADHKIAETAARALEQVEDSRAYLTRVSCRQRNTERRILRGQIRDDLRTLRTVPEGTLEQLGLSRAELREQNVGYLDHLHPLDCEGQVARIRASSPPPPRLRPPPPD